jgi:hypothetical protein
VTHLSDRQVEDFRRRALSPRELLAVDDHIAACPECRLRLAEGESLSGSLAAWESLGESDASPLPAHLVPRPSLFPRRLPVFPAAAVLLAAVGLAVGLAGWGTKPAVELMDGGKRVRLSSRGELVGLELLPAAQRQEIAAALQVGHLDKPQEIDGLAGRGSVLRGAAAPPSGFVLLAPLATAVLDGRPIFRWTPLPGAESYQVKVFDANLAPVADSGPISATEWRPSRPLPAGGVYAWQIVARRDGEDRTAPDPGSPPALFRVLATDQAEALERAAHAAGGSHLALGVLYAHGGLVGEAQRELEQVVAANPRSATARRLLASVRAWRPAASQVPSPTSTKAAQ